MDDLIQSSESPANANTASNSTTATAQFTGNASLHSDPSSLSPAALMSSPADLLWCADTGAMSLLVMVSSVSAPQMLQLDDLEILIYTYIY